MLTPEPHFRRVTWSEGYDRAEVDAFVERLQATAEGRAGGSPVTADEARTIRFRSVRFGGAYDMEQVDDFLEQVQALLDAPR